MAPSATATRPRTRTATARRAPARKPAPPRAPARKPTPRRAPVQRPKTAGRRSAPTPVGGNVAVAAARTAGAVGGIADSGLFVWLTRGRLWIGLLGGLLVGIVALNVMALSFNSSSSRAASEADELARINSTYRAQIAEQLSRDEVQAAATALGLGWPAPSVITYVRPSAGDAAKAAQRLRNGELTLGSAAAPVTVAAAPVEAEPTEIAAVEAAPVVEEPVAEPPPVAPETAAPTTAIPTEPAVAAPVGAVATP